MAAFLTEHEQDGLFIGRVWSPQANGPCVVTLRGGDVFDITSRTAPTVRDICELDNPSDYVREQKGVLLGTLADIAANVVGDFSKIHFLAPCDFHAVKGCGVTFAKSMVERVIEEKASGDPSKAADIRLRIGDMIGESLKNIKPGSPEAEVVKQTLIQEGIWSQYLEVGIGPYAEIFSKAQVLSSVGFGAEIGVNPISQWNNPEPEIVLLVSSAGNILGATLGNDVNLRDIEGRSALLLCEAKDNNASCSIGPMFRLFDDTFSLDDVRNIRVDLKVSGEDGFVLQGYSSMSEISRDPVELVAQALGAHHQYPDGLVMFLGTLFAPTEDRDEPGGGFTHKIGDIVQISAAGLGILTNKVQYSTECQPWIFGASHLMRNLASRGLL